MDSIKTHLKKNINHTQEQIKEAQETYDKAKKGTNQVVLIILGFFGLLFFILPGIVIFILAAVEYNNNKKTMISMSQKIKDLERELADYEFKLTQLK